MFKDVLFHAVYNIIVTFLVCNSDTYFTSFIFIHVLITTTNFLGVFKLQGSLEFTSAIYRTFADNSLESDTVWIDSECTGQFMEGR